MSFYVFGDYHGAINSENYFLTTKQFPEQKSLSKKDIVFQLGDFGLPWFYPELTNFYKKELAHLTELASKKYTLFIIPGNHDNYDLINKLPLIDFYQGQAYIFETKNGPIYFAKRGEIYVIDNKIIFTFSGAKTSDMEERYTYQDYLNKNKVFKKNRRGFKRLKTMKLSYVQYWPQELPTKEEYSYAIHNLKKYNFQVDYIFTHTGPKSVLSNIFSTIEEDFSEKLNDPVSDFLEEIMKKTSFKEWHFGHIHMNTNFKNFYSHYKEKPYLLS